MKSEYLKAFEKFVYFRCGEVDQYIFENEHLDACVCNAMENIFKIPEKRFVKAVDDYVLKGKPQNKLLFGNKPVIDFNFKDPIIMVHPKDTTRSFAFVLRYHPDKNNVSINLSDLERHTFEFDQKCNFTKVGIYDAMHSLSTCSFEYEKQPEMTFEKLTETIAKDYIKKVIGLDFEKENLETLKRDGDTTFGKNTFGYTKTQGSKENEIVESLIFNKYLPCGECTDIPLSHIYREVFIKNDDGWYHMTEENTHTQRALEKFRETGEFIFVGANEKVMRNYLENDPIIYYALTENKDLVEEQFKKEIEKAEAEKHKKRLEEAGKETEKETKKPARKTTKTPAEKKEQKPKTAETKTAEKPKTAKQKENGEKSVQKPKTTQKKSTSQTNLDSPEKGDE